MLPSVEPGAPTAFSTFLTASFAAGFLARSTVLRDFGMTGFGRWFLGLFYGLRRRFPAKSQGYRLEGSSAKASLSTSPSRSKQRAIAPKTLPKSAV